LVDIIITGHSAGVVSDSIISAPASASTSASASASVSTLTKDDDR